MSDSYRGPPDEATSSRRTMRSATKTSFRVLGGPLISYLDRRFQEMYDRFDQRLDELYNRVATEVETMSEMALGMQRFIDVSGRQLDDAIATLRELEAKIERLADVAAAAPPPATGKRRRRGEPE